MTDLPVFVYGTLLEGESQAPLLAGLGRRPATVRGRLYHLPAGYPALTIDGDDIVHGQLVEAPHEAVLHLIDHYEGVDTGLFERVQVRAILGALRGVRCWAWVMEDPVAVGGIYLSHGRWRAFRRR